MKFNIKPFILTGYRSISFVFLFGIFFGIIWYTLAFCLMSTSSSRWAAPIVLSPTQTIVLEFQPQVATLETTLDTQRIALTTNKSTVIALKETLGHVNENINRIRSSMKAEAQRNTMDGLVLSKIQTDKIRDVNNTIKLSNDIRRIDADTDRELTTGLITKDEASQRHLYTQNAINGTTDLRSSAVILGRQVSQLRNDAETLNHSSSSSIVSMQAVKTLSDLEIQKYQAEIQLKTASDNVIALSRQVEESTRVLNVAKQSPYYIALKRPVNAALVTYPSIKGLKIGDPVYDCTFMIVVCHKAGVVSRFYDAEIASLNPIFRTTIKGRLIEIAFDDEHINAAQSQIVFLGRKPLFL